jgi:hypothetical protein
MDKDYYGVDAVSNSGMASINPAQGGSPLRYKKYVIDRAGGFEDSKALYNGKLIHLYVEDPGAFSISTVERPTDMLASWVEEVYGNVKMLGPDCVNDASIYVTALGCKKDRYKSLKDEVKVLDKFKDGIPYLRQLFVKDNSHCVTAETKALLENCIASLRGNAFGSELLFKKGEDWGDSVFNELPIYWEENGLQCKALLDRVRVFESQKIIQLIDLKTTSKAVAVFPDSFDYWRYYRQMAWYKHAIEIHFGKDYTIEVFMVVVETTGLYETRVFKVGDESLKKGVVEYEGLLKRIKKVHDGDMSLEGVFDYELL